MTPPTAEEIEREKARQMAARRVTDGICGAAVIIWMAIGGGLWIGVVPLRWAVAIAGVAVIGVAFGAMLFLTGADDCQRRAADHEGMG